jgi:hypothetical protein
VSCAPVAHALPSKRSRGTSPLVSPGVFLHRVSQPPSPCASPQTYVLAALYLLEDANADRLASTVQQRMCGVFACRNGTELFD